MVKLCLLGVLGVVVGFAATAWHEPAYACSCVDFNAWKLTLVDASPEVDRAAWQLDDIYFNMNAQHSTTLHSNNARFELAMENK